MKVAFHASPKTYDLTLAEAFGRGCRARKVPFEIVSCDEFSAPIAGIGLAVVVGVKSKSSSIFKAYRAAGVDAVLFDKGYTRLRGGALGTLYWRMSFNNFQPLAYFQSARRPSDRWRQLGLSITTHQPGRRIIFAGSSQKYCDFQGLGDATKYATSVMSEIRQRTDLEIVYRPKPSWGDAVAIDGFAYSPPKEKFAKELKRAWAVVTHGSNACFEAMLAGVPTIILGDGITRPVSSTDLSEIDCPRVPTTAEAHQLAYDVAYCQWTLEEIESAAALDTILAMKR